MAELSTGTPPAATQSIHRDYLEQASPAWLIHATPARRAQLKAAPASLPAWYQHATPQQRRVLNEKFTAGFTAQTVLDKAMARLQDVETFAEPLLVKALHEQFNLQLDVRKTLLQLHKSVEVEQVGVTFRSYEVMRLPLLQAVLHNFEASECERGAFLASSGFITQATAGGETEAVSTTLTVPQFTTLCRTLDIGGQYQRYLATLLHGEDSVAEQVLRQKFCAARKADLAAAAEAALLKKDIEPADYRMINSVIAGEMHPRMGNKQVWFNDLGLMKKRMTGCVAFVICEKYRYATDLILYIPHDPHHPLKRFTQPQMEAMFKQRFTARDTPDPGDGRPTAYQRFFSQFVDYGDLPAYFNELNESIPAPGSIASRAPYSPLLVAVVNGFNPFAAFNPVVDLPPDAAPTQRPIQTPFLHPITLSREGQGVWSDNVDLWDYLFDQHRAKLIADARAHAVPTAVVDARVRSEKFAKLLNIGLLALNVVSMFVPVLGEVMMVVMAGQLLYETLEGCIEWSEGDRRAAKAHLVDVAENLAFMAVMAAGGKVLSKVIAVKPEPLIEDLHPVALPDGQQRLWRAALQGYESPVTLPADTTANPQGEFHHGGKNYIRLSGKLYEKTFDTDLKRWRIQHPSDPQAYQPLLSHNGAGAWRHTLERPASWDRTTLMRRLGPQVDGFTDEQLLSIADISGISDNALRKMHLDNATPPPALADTLRLFKADQGVAQVIEQVSTGRAVDGRYLFTLPLVTELPNWPVGRVLQVFDGPGLTGRFQRYGVERLRPGVRRKAAIRVSRADVLSSQLPKQILAALDESEVVGLLGGEAARVSENRPQAFRQQLADHARSREAALFDSLYKGTDVPDPWVAKLQRLHPGLSEHAAQRVLADADVEQLGRLQATGRVPLAMQEQARWYVREGRMSRAYAGLHMENMLSADSKRLALHTLSALPGWSDQVRLEIREGNILGSLLDSIGSPTAPQRNYLVKKGPLYLAFNERGEVLNNLPRHGDNFYASLMHALPDDARQALGVPNVGQSLDLRRALINHAVEHRIESTRIVEDAPARQSWFKPPQRISATRIGYPASGGTEGGMSALASRAQAIYPDMDELQANDFVLARYREGMSEPQIFTRLENLRREWETLDTTLRAWEQAPTHEVFVRANPVFDPRSRMASALRRSWQRAPLPELPGHATLSLNGDVALPPISADFSHVRSLTLAGRRLMGADLRPVLRHFPELQALTLVGADTPLHCVPAGLEQLHQLTNLHIESRLGMSAAEQARMESLSGLQQLNLNIPSRLSRPLDVSRMTGLRSLTLSGEGLRDFPVGLTDLADLERLDFKRSAIGELAPQLFEPGRERLWSALSLDWSHFTRERFKPAYDYVRSQTEHVMNLDEMVSEYCYGQLDNHLGRPAETTPSAGRALSAEFFSKWADAQGRFDAIEALGSEYAALAERLETWVGQGVDRMAQFNRARIDEVLRGSWYRGIWARYGLNRPAPLNLAGMVVSELPRLPADGFAHVTELRLQNAQVPTAQLDTFMRGFSALRTLDASNCGLTELTLAAGDWPALEHLDLSGNPLVALDVSGLWQLRALSLRRSTLSTWPTGVEHLPQLQWLDLRDSHITQLPPSALEQNRVLLVGNFAGAHLNEAQKAVLAAARQRIEQGLGLSDGTLNRFDQQWAGSEFPPHESSIDLARQLLPLRWMYATDDALSLEQRLQRLHLDANAERAGQWLARRRDEGLSDGQVDDRISVWEQSFDEMTCRLNSWIFRRQSDFGDGRIATSTTRRVAGQRIRDRWSDGMLNLPYTDRPSLDLSGLILGDLPELPTTLDRVVDLNVEGIQMTAQGSNDFLRCFPNLRSVSLGSNPLGEIPEAVAEMSGLASLSMPMTGLNDHELLYPALARLPVLNYLNLTDNGLQAFRAEGLRSLRTL